MWSRKKIEFVFFLDHLPRFQIGLLKKMSGVRKLTTFFCAKNDHRWVTFVFLKTINSEPFFGRWSRISKWLSMEESKHGQLSCMDHDETKYTAGSPKPTVPQSEGLTPLSAIFSSRDGPTLFVSEESEQVQKAFQHVATNLRQPYHATSSNQVVFGGLEEVKASPAFERRPVISHRSSERLCLSGYGKRRFDRILKAYAKPIILLLNQFFLGSLFRKIFSTDCLPKTTWDRPELRPPAGLLLSNFTAVRNV